LAFDAIVDWQLLREGICVPDLEIVNQLSLCVVDGLLVEGGLILVLFELIKGLTVLTLQFLHLLNLDQFLLVDDVFNWLLVSIQEPTMLGGTWRHGLPHISLLLFLSHAIKHILNLVNLSFDLVAFLSLDSDLVPGFFEGGTALLDSLLVLGTRLRFNSLELQESSLLVDWLTRVGLLLAGARHLLEHLLLLLLVELLIMSFGELFVLLHLSDFFLALFADLDLGDWLGLSWSDTETETALVQQITHTFTLGFLPLSLLVSTTDLVAANVLLSSQKVGILLLQFSKAVPHLHQELISLPNRCQLLNVFLLPGQVLKTSLLDFVLLLSSVWLSDSGLAPLGSQNIVQCQLLLQISDFSFEFLDQEWLVQGLTHRRLIDDVAHASRESKRGQSFFEVSLLGEHVRNEDRLAIATNRVGENVGQLALPVRHVLTLLVTRGHHNLFQIREGSVDVAGFFQGQSFSTSLFGSLAAGEVDQVQLGINHFFGGFDRGPGFEVDGEDGVGPGRCLVQEIVGCRSVSFTLE